MAVRIRFSWSILNLYRYATVRRGSMFVVMFALAFNPWRLLTQATDFIQVLNIFAVLSSCTGPILIADYWLSKLNPELSQIKLTHSIVRKRKWEVPGMLDVQAVSPFLRQSVSSEIDSPTDLYHEDGIYWFYHGWNWRAAIAWVLAMIPSFRKCLGKLLMRQR